MFDISQFLPIIIFVVGLFLSVAIVVGIKVSAKKAVKKTVKHEPNALNLKLNKEYISKKEMSFLNAVHKALPNEFIAFPKVPLMNLILPTSDKVSYNLVYDKVIDVCVFSRDSFEPILAIDLLELEVTSFSFNKLDETSKKALKSLKVPLLEVQVAENYDVNKLRKDLINTMPDKIVAMLKQNINK